jgi:hypothetical protein
VSIFRQKQKEFEQRYKETLSFDRELAEQNWITAKAFERVANEQERLEIEQESRDLVDWLQPEDERLSLPFPVGSVGNS